jgi:hypothetical protein
MSDASDIRQILEQAERAVIADDLSSADALLRTAARLQETELGPLHPELASTLSNLGIVAEKAERPRDAEMFYRRAAAIASASLPADHPIVVDSRKNLEDFCRERNLPVDADAAVVPAPPQISRPAPPALHTTSRLLAQLALVVLVVAAGVLLVRRASSSRETPPPLADAPTNAQAATQAPIQPSVPLPVEERQTPATPSRSDDRDVVPPTRRNSAPATSAPVSLATAQLCQTLSRSGDNWTCNPAGNSVPRKPLLLYTRVKSARDTAVVHRWYRGNALRQSAKLPVRANVTQGYRTYSRFSVDAAGDWRVEVRSVNGDLLYEQRFAVR